MGERIILFKTILHFFVVHTQTDHASKIQSIKNKYHDNIYLCIIHIHISIWITYNVNEQCKGFFIVCNSLIF